MRFKKGHTPWNKGLTKETSESVRNISINLMGEKNPRYGKQHTQEWKDNLSKRMRENHPMKGKKHTLEAKNKMKLAKVGTHQSKETIQKRFESRKGYKHSIDTINKIKETRINSGGYSHTKDTKKKIKESRKKQITPVKDTKIEVKIQKLLSQLHLEYFTHKYISEIINNYQCDIFIPVQEGIIQKTVIECDGCYWHGCPICNLKLYDKIEERKILDGKRTAQLKEAGFRVIRLWEHKIKKMDSHELKQELVILR